MAKKIPAIKPAQRLPVSQVTNRYIPQPDKAVLNRMPRLRAAIGLLPKRIKGINKNAEGSRCSEKARVIGYGKNMFASQNSCTPDSPVRNE
jgi:hypothetical protein